MEKKSILIVDDHTIFCEGLRRVIEAQQEYVIVGIAKNGLEAINLAGKHRPDVILMDIEMPKMGGVEATCAIKKCYPKIKVIMLTMHAEEQFIVESSNAGACGYILKDAFVDVLLEAIVNAINQGEDAYEDDMYTIFSTKSECTVPELTDREKEVIKLLAAGLTNKEIARQLFVSTHTIKNHLTNIYSKLNCVNRAGALRCFHAIDNDNF